jgi:hypothetical protein
MAMRLYNGTSGTRTRRYDLTLTLSYKEGEYIKISSTKGGTLSILNCINLWKMGDPFDGAKPA